MSCAVPLTEAVAILKRMVEAPDMIRSIRAFDRFPSGPVPFFVALPSGEAEVTVTFAMDALEAVASVRVGDRFANIDDWYAEAATYALDELGDIERDLFEACLRSAGRR